MLVGEELLREEDAEFLKRKGWDCEAITVNVGNDRKEVLIVVHKYALPPRYRPSSVDLLVRQLPGYPETGMDMFWTRPDVVLSANGHKPDRADVVETYNGLSWQRWSRHLNGWRPQTDNLETFFASIARELSK
jgi:hypothetical protein